MPLTVGLEAINNPTGEAAELFPKNTPQRLKKVVIGPRGPETSAITTTQNEVK